MPQDTKHGNTTEIAERVYSERSRTYRGFLHMTKWFTIHAALILIGLYLFGILGMANLGFLLVLVGIAALLYGPYAASRAARSRESQYRASYRAAE